MHTAGIGVLLGITAMVTARVAGAAPFVRQDEMRARDQWAKPRLLTARSQPPFCFTYAGKPSGALLVGWAHTFKHRALDTMRTEYTHEWSDGATGLQVRCVAISYRDYPAIEWTTYLKNTGATPTPVLRDIQGIDAVFTKQAGSQFVLRGNKGDWCAPEGYEPYTLTLAPNQTKRFAPDGGRPTNGPNGWPYYNLQWDDGGVMLAIGWPGQWASAFTRDAADGLRVVAGQELTRLSLRPGEVVRTPLTALVFWRGGDTVRAQNLWRRWYMAHVIPKYDGKPPAVISQIQLSPILKGDEKAQFAEIHKFEHTGIDIDVYWNDAGWYPCGADPQWWMTGTWEPDYKRYPNGFKPVSRWIHDHGKNLIVWFEPERNGNPNSWLAMNYPNWLLGGTLLNLGDPAAWKWLVNHIDTVMNENGIDYYRQDFNMDPLEYWRKNDADDRQGVTENLHVQAYLAFWDELRRRHPHMLIDSCSSGGRRNDLETMRRAVPLLRSDFQPRSNFEAQHGQTYGISSWLPYYGSGIDTDNLYQARSYYMPAFGMGGDRDKKFTKQCYDECRKVAPLMLSDYYPLTGYSLSLDQWIGYQYNRPEQGDGVVMAYRRDQCAQGSITVQLRGLDPAKRYVLTNFDVPGATEYTGAALMQTGITITVNTNPGSAILMYHTR